MRTHIATSLPFITPATLFFLSFLVSFWFVGTSIPEVHRHLVIRPRTVLLGACIRADDVGNTQGLLSFSGSVGYSYLPSVLIVKLLYCRRRT